MPVAELPACVFCGRPIGPGEAVAGRAPMAAHASCADAALADDAHWEAIDAGSGGPEEADPPAARRAGCLGSVVAVLLVVVLLVLLT